MALAKQIMDANLRGEKFRVSVWTGASTAPELDGALAMVDGVELRLPYQSDPICRKKINAGDMEYLDIHLSHVGAVRLAPASSASSTSPSSRSRGSARTAT